ncbi:hypothetical protein BT93_E0771 [Corymbia citriodora subsp. variegata]|nr:hypothetical protein BT93_E0771 [Corymbia citriodora subsp. variegata]
MLPFEFQDSSPLHSCGFINLIIVRSSSRHQDQMIGKSCWHSELYTMQSLHLSIHLYFLSSSCAASCAMALAS